MLRHIPNSQLYVSEPNPTMFGNPPNPPSPGGSAPAPWTNSNWLLSRFHFSFAEYHSRHNSQFGVLRVMNDDLVQPSRGFGTHGHGDMEIATYIVDGELTHQDSTGGAETLGRGSVQFMSAGTGVRHSERNRSATAPLRFIQMWILPRDHGTSPKYGGYAGDAAARRGKWQHLVGDCHTWGELSTPDDVATADAAPSGATNGAAQAPTGPQVTINADANIYVAEIEAQHLAFAVQRGRQAYALIVEGTDISVSLSKTAENETSGSTKSDDVITAQGFDAFEIYGGDRSANVKFAPGAAGPAHILIVEMAQDGRGGREDF